MTLVVCSLIESNIQEASSSSRTAFSEGADLVELRLDHISGLSLPTIREARREILGPMITTLRSKRQGGKSGTSGAEREAILTEMLESDFEYVDVELDTDRSFLKRMKVQESGPEIIVSSHLSVPVSREIIEKKLLEAWVLGDIAKVSMPCENAVQALMLAHAGLKFSRQKKRFVLIGMGPQGQLTRVFADRIGSELAYACISGKEAAPGQLNVTAQAALLNKRRTVFGLIGHPVSHSVSKPMQEEALKNLGLTGAYLPLDFPAKEFDGNAVRSLKALGFKGLNVTIPHKGMAFKLCDRRGDSAAATRAVNTISFDGRRIVGENTDVNGFSRLLDGKMCITKYTDSLLIGAGGAARAVAYVLSERKVKLSVTDIEKSRADDLAKKFGAKSLSLRRLWKSTRSFDLVVNCTPVGMKGVPGNPLKASFVKPGSVFIDVIYNPPVTKAMQTAEKRGAKVYGGLEMLVQQGAESFRLWTGSEPSVDAMREAARRALQ